MQRIARGYIARHRVYAACGGGRGEGGADDQLLPTGDARNLAPMHAEEPNWIGDEAPLAAGYERCVAHTGEEYYYNVSTGESSWERPVDVPTLPSAAAHDELPENVEVCLDDNGYQYFFNVKTGESTWERPKTVRAFNKVKVLSQIGAFQIEGKKEGRKVEKNGLL